MGTRANIGIEQWGGKVVYLYTHWSGDSTPEMLRKALARRKRWDDPSYLARIIFDAMTEDDHGSETGFGIDALPATDANRPLLMVHPGEAPTVTMHPGREPNAPPLKTWTFEEFLETGADAFTSQEAK